MKRRSFVKALAATVMLPVMLRKQQSCWLCKGSRITIGGPSSDQQPPACPVCSGGPRPRVAGFGSKDRLDVMLTREQMNGYYGAHSYQQRPVISTRMHASEIDPPPYLRAKTLEDWRS